MKALIAGMLDVPGIPAMLGYAGLLPFVFLSLGLWFVPEAYVQGFNSALLSYASIILAFMGAVHWGLAMQQDQGLESRQSVWSVVPALIAWFASMAPVMLNYSILTVTFAMLCLFDGRMISRAGRPGGTSGCVGPLTAVVVASLIIAQLSLLP